MLAAGKKKNHRFILYLHPLLSLKCIIIWLSVANYFNIKTRTLTNLQKTNQRCAMKCINITKHTLSCMNYVIKTNKKCFEQHQFKMIIQDCLGYFFFSLEIMIETNGIYIEFTVGTRSTFKKRGGSTRICQSNK